MNKGILIIPLLLFELLTGCATTKASNSESATADYKSPFDRREELPVSSCSQEKCYLCGSNRPDILDFYDSPETVVVLCLNTWNVGDTRLYELDDYGNPVSDVGHTTMSHDSHGEGNCRWSFFSDPERHTCDLAISYGDGAELNPETLSGQLCQDCLDRIYDTVFSWGYDEEEVYHCDILMDVSENEFYSLSPNMVGYYINDYWVHIEHDKENGEDSVYLIYNPKE